MEELQRLLVTEAALCRQMHDIIAAEKRALADNDTEELSRQTQAKAPLAQSLAAASDAREQWLAERGLKKHLHGVEQWLADNPSPALQRCYEELLTLAEACRRDNLMVGSMIRKHQLANDRALQVLRTGSLHTPDTYSATGTGATGSLAIPLAKA